MIQFRYQSVLGVPLALILAGFMLNGYNIAQIFQHYYKNCSMKADLDRYADAQIVRALETAPAENESIAVSNEQLLTPELATEFVKWLMQGAFDFNPRTESRSHIEAAKWLEYQPYQIMESLFWKTSEEELISFNPYSVEPTAGTSKTGIEVNVLARLGKQIDENHFKSTIIKIKFKVNKVINGLRITEIKIADNDKAMLAKVME